VVPSVYHSPVTHSLITHLRFAAVIAPLILTLGAVQMKRVPTWLVACPHAAHHARQLLGVDRHYQAAIGACRQRCSHEGFLCGPHQNNKRRLCPAGLASQGSAQPQGFSCLIAGTND